MAKPAEALSAQVLRGHAPASVLTDIEVGELYADSVAAFFHSFNKLLRGAGTQEELGAAHHVALLATRLWCDRCRARKLVPPGGTPEMRREVEALALELLASIREDQEGTKLA